MRIGPKNPVAKHLRVMIFGMEIPDVLTVNTTGMVARVIAPPMRVCDPLKPRTPCDECYLYRDKPHLAVQLISGVEFQAKPDAPWWVPLACRLLGAACKPA